LSLGDTLALALGVGLLFALDLDDDFLDLRNF